MMLLVEVRDDEVGNAIKAVLPFALGEPKLLKTVPPPVEVADDQSTDALAENIAKVVAPTGNRSMRSEALKVVLNGYDTYTEQRAEADPALRNAITALSKALRPFSKGAAPVELLCHREKTYFGDGPCKGMYKGTSYHPTKLGIRVRELLKAQGAL